MSGSTITWEEGWAKIEVALSKLFAALENGVSSLSTNLFSAGEYMKVYTQCFDLSTQRLNNYAEKLYEKHNEVIEMYLKEKVFPFLEQQSQQLNYDCYTFVAAFMRRFQEHLLATKWMSQFFSYLDRYYVKQSNKPSLKLVSLKLFSDNIYTPMKETLLRSFRDIMDRYRNKVLESLKSGVMMELSAEDASIFGGFVDLYVYLSTNPDSVVTKIVRGELTFRENMESPYYRTEFQDLFADDFEKEFLSIGSSFYVTMAKSYLHQVENPQTDVYIKLCEMILTSEKNFCEELMDKANKLIWREHNPGLDLTKDFNGAREGTKPKVIDILNESLLSPYQKVLIESKNCGLHIMFEEHQTSNLKLFYSLYKDILINGSDALVPIAQVFKEYVVAKGVEIRTVVQHKPSAADKKQKALKNMKLNNTMKLIDAYIDLLDKYQSLVKNEFGNHGLFARSLKEAFEKFLNNPQQIGSESETFDITEKLSNYIDFNIKQQEKLTTADFDKNKLENAVSLFEYISEKDKFNEIYRNQLAKRILNNFTSSETYEISEVEVFMISKFKSIIGAGYTQKMETMIKDLRTAVAKRRNNMETEELQFSVTLLNSSSWPPYINMDVNYPSPMKELLAQYNQNYLETTAKRKISWAVSLGTVVVETNIPYKSGKFVTLEINTLQATVLLLFNEGSGKMSMRALMDASNLELTILKKVLHSFLRPGILQKDGKFESLAKFDMDDVYFVNYNGLFKKQKMKVPMPSLEESHNPAKVEQDRTFTIDAAIVRIMKSRKTLQHEELMGQILNQLQLFKPTSEKIKIRIDDLITRDYIERDEDDPKCYRYVS